MYFWNLCNDNMQEAFQITEDGMAVFRKGASKLAISFIYLYFFMQNPGVFDIPVRSA